MANVTLDELRAELARGRAKFPGNRLLLPALVEEVGELCAALVDGNREAVRREAIQVATVAIWIAEEGDATNYSLSPLALLVDGLGDVARRLLQRRGLSAIVAADMVSALHLISSAGDRAFADITAQESQPWTKMVQWISLR